MFASHTLCLLLVMNSLQSLFICLVVVFDDEKISRYLFCVPRIFLVDLDLQVMEIVTTSPVTFGQIETKLEFASSIVQYILLFVYIFFLYLEQSTRRLKAFIFMLIFFNYFLFI